MFEKNIWLVLLLTVFLAACGGGGSSGPDLGDNGGDGGGGDDDDDDDDEEDPLLGKFIDSAVAGIGYETATQEGQTSAAGEFEYLAGESVTFFIGDLKLPATVAGEIVTPLEIFATANLADQRVINLARLLQSLDSDSNPDNGITLTTAAHASATGVTIDFDVPTETFAANTAVINLVSNGGGAGTLVSAADALEHLQQASTLVGSWQVEGADEYLAITFMANGTYLIAESNDTGMAEDDGGKPGIEYGTYSWNPVTGKITATPVIDTNGSWGLSSARPDLTLKRTGDKVVLTETMDDGSVDTAEFVRVTSDDNTLVGGWVMRFGADLAVVVFNGTHFAWAETGTGADGATEGAEFGGYVWDAETGAFTATVTRDDNGDDGLSGAPPALQLHVDGDTLTATTEGMPAATFMRVGATVIVPGTQGLVGSWYLLDGEDYIAATFMADGKYMIAEGTAFDEADPNGFPGVEYGTYSYDAATMKLTATVIADTNGDWGLSHSDGGETVERDGNVVHFIDSSDADDDMYFTRAVSATNPLVGAWVADVPEDAPEGVALVLTFTGTHYAWAEVSTPENTGPEFGSYTWNPATGAFSYGLTVDENGPGGFSDVPGGLTIAVDGDTMDVLVDGAEAISFTRVK